MVLSLYIKVIEKSVKCENMLEILHNQSSINIRSRHIANYRLTGTSMNEFEHQIMMIYHVFVMKFVMKNALITKS